MHNMMSIKTPIAALILLCSSALPALSGDPTWKVLGDFQNHRYLIVVNAAGLAKNEYLQKAACQVVLLDKTGKEVSTVTQNVTVPIQAGTSRTDEFPVTDPRIVKVRGKVMDWEIVPGGIVVGIVRTIPKSRHGSTPADPDE
jgi:hypothetical protein